MLSETNGNNRPAVTDLFIAASGKGSQVEYLPF